MAFLEFIRNRNKRQQESSQPSQQQETAKEMYSRQAVELSKSVGNLSQAQRAEAKEIGSELRQATQEISSTGTSPSSAPAPDGSNPEAMRQKMMQQDNAAPSLSPTTAQRGVTANEQEQPASQSSQQTDKTIPRPTTIARPQPSWER
jgi:hypothetical protein